MGRFNNLPKDIMLEILIRLPTESVLECKLVCKLWRDIVRLPSFSDMHLARLNSADGDSGKLGFVFLNREQGLSEFCYTEYNENCQEKPFSRETRMDLNPPFGQYSLIGSCNGLICFDSWLTDGIGQIHNRLTYVCNPITREYIILPDFERNFFSWTGFGYSSSTNEYKVVRIDKSREESNVRIVHVYTLGSGWRTVGKMDKNMEQVRQPTGAFANGALHWVDEEGTVLAFGLTDEKFSEIPPPPPSLTQDAVPYLTLVQKALGGFLGAIFYYDAGDVDRVGIWLLKKNTHNHNLSWSKEFSFNSDIRFPFGLSKSGRLLCYLHKKFYSFDSKASSVKLDASFDKSIFQAIPHKNTLVSLKVLDEKHTIIMEFGERLRSSKETGSTIN